MSRDEDYELWLAMNEDFEASAPAQTPTIIDVPPAEPTPPAEVPVEFVQIFEQAVDQEESEQGEEEVEFEFENSPNLFKEPQTNTIVIQPLDPLATEAEVARTEALMLD